MKLNCALTLSALVEQKTFLLQEKTDIQESFDRYKDEMSDVTETVEIATLDKEMAEEKVVYT